jgi:hypothetical protein
MSKTNEPAFPAKRVINGDTMKIVETFDPKETEEKVKYYQSLGKWNDVSVDKDGDIILWED